MSYVMFIGSVLCLCSADVFVGISEERWNDSKFVYWTMLLPTTAEPLLLQCMVVNRASVLLLPYWYTSGSQVFIETNSTGVLQFIGATGWRALLWIANPPATLIHIGIIWRGDPSITNPSFRERLIRQSVQSAGIVYCLLALSRVHWIMFTLGMLHSSFGTYCLFLHRLSLYQFRDDVSICIEWTC